MKKFLTIGFITILILLTTYTKNLTKQLTKNFCFERGDQFNE